MAYTIKRSDGSILVSIPDQTKNANATSLVLVGRGAINYGTDFAENFVHVTENFADLLPPRKPLTGQLWWDLNVDKLKIWNGTEWQPAQGKTSSNGGPGSIVVLDENGDFFARIVHADLDGNASTASKLKTPRTLSLTGDATGSVAFDGSRDVSINVSVASADAAQKAVTADRLTTARDIALAGDVTGTASFSGAANLRIDAKIANSVGTSGAVPGTLVRRNDNGDVAADVFIGALRGNADSAAKWATARKITLAGDASGEVTLDGTDNETLTVSVKSVPATSLANTGVTPGTYDVATVTVDAKGRITKISEGSVSNTTVNNATYSNTSNIANTANVAKIANYSNTAGSSNTATFATKAGQWDFPITMTLGDDLRGSVSFDGSNNVTLNGAIANTRVTPGVYPISNVRQFEIGSDGRIIAIANGTTTGGGASDTADKWTTARTLTLNGDITGSVSIDGSQNVTLTTNLANSGVTPGVYRNIDIRNIEYLADGRVKAFTQYAANAARLNISDLPNIMAGYNMKYSPEDMQTIPSSGPAGSTPVYYTTVVMKEWNCAPDGTRIIHVSSGSGDMVGNDVFYKFQVYAGTKLLYDQGGSGSPWNRNGVHINPEVNPIYERNNDLTTYTLTDYIVKIAMFGSAPSYNVVTRILMTEFTK